ncbi:MAG: hypothetical protein FWG16_02120 [Micrococcales bacterium]|nr:hypothetical protein [Micrococcales bacterium]
MSADQSAEKIVQDASLAPEVPAEQQLEALEKALARLEDLLEKAKEE